MTDRTSRQTQAGIGHSAPAHRGGTRDNSREPVPQAKGVYYLDTPLKQLHESHRASSSAERGDYVQLCSTPRGARGVEPETFGRRRQLSCPLTTGPSL